MLDNQLVKDNFALLGFFFGVLVADSGPASLGLWLCVIDSYKSLVVIFELGGSLFVVIFLKELKFRLHLTRRFSWSD